MEDIQRDVLSLLRCGLDHDPVQHRDGKPPWCQTCGLTRDGRIPVSRIKRKESSK